MPDDPPETDPPVEARDGNGLVGAGARAAGATARLAFRPARAAAREFASQTEGVRSAARRRIDEAVEDAVSDPRTAGAIDRALAGPVVEAVALSLVRQRVVERAVAAVLADEQARAQLAASLSDERTALVAREVLSSAQIEAVVDEVAASRLAAEITERILASPDLRAALTRQGASLAGDTSAAVVARAERLDDAIEVLVRRRPPTPERHAYGGIVTRAVGLVVDAVAVYVFVLGAVGALALVASLFWNLHHAGAAAVLVGSGSTIAAAVYFTLFWSTTGQTPGMRLVGVRVEDGRAGPPSVGRSLLRVVGLALAIIPLFAGFLPVLFDARRRGLHDWIAGTVVIRSRPDAPA